MEKKYVMHLITIKVNLTQKKKNTRLEYKPLSGWHQRILGLLGLCCILWRFSVDSFQWSLPHLVSHSLACKRIFQFPIEERKESKGVLRTIITHKPNLIRYALNNSKILSLYILTVKYLKIIIYIKYIYISVRT